jgi:hypothetical protein
MKQIRKGVFETNSSSTHTLHFSQEEFPEYLKDTTLQPDWDGDLIVDSDMQFGWGFEIYSEASAKASYVGIMLHMLKKWKEIDPSERSEDWFQERVRWANENFDICRENFVEVLREEVGFKRIEIPSDRLKIGGYIDHQSAEDISDFEFLLDKEKVRSLIFNPYSLILTGNDNSDFRWSVDKEVESNKERISLVSKSQERKQLTSKNEES